MIKIKEEAIVNFKISVKHKWEKPGALRTLDNLIWRQGYSNLMNTKRGWVMGRGNRIGRRYRF